MRTKARNDQARNGVAGESRRAIASYPNYSEAERAVDYLSDQKFPVERVAIVARDLRIVEQVTGRMGYGGAALRGAVSGAFVGFLVGWLFGIFDWFNPVVAAAWLAFDGLWFGAVVGALMGLLLQALTRGRRDFASVAGMTADHYDVIVDEEVAAEAARLLAGLGGTPSTSNPEPRAA
ncbi:MAG: hypothetical protein QOE56_720 [Solirubrobacterales bacterium]|jgi:hypothetical protein|nr:hypothetical protein [Solirubrobacterales bacterium]